MTFIISSAFVAAVVYFAIALTAFIHDRLKQRFLSRCEATDCLCIEDFDPDTDVPTDDVLIHSLVASPLEVVDEAIAVPTKKADLITFIREHNLQKAVYKLTGASYSNGTVNKLPVLRAAVLEAIA